jgi:hypothetical protein
VVYLILVIEVYLRRFRKNKENMEEKKNDSEHKLEDIFHE